MFHSFRKCKSRFVNVLQDIRLSTPRPSFSKWYMYSTISKDGRKIRLDGCHCDIYVLICDLNHASISVTFSLEQRQDLYDRPIQQPNVHLRNYTPSKNEIDNGS